MRITANRVTLARIVLLPIPCALVLWGDAVGLFVALLLGAVLGATDAVDGYLARRDGPTVLGGLLDPAADKLFVAAFVLPLTAAGYCPPWVAAGIFFREMVITALRTSMSLRDEKLVTSWLGKLKTVVQMGGLAVFYFTAFVPEAVMRWVHALGAGGFALVSLGYLAIGRRKPPFWLGGATPLWAGIAAVVFLLGKDEAIFSIFVLMLALTWVSGVDYFFGAAKVLKAEGMRKDDLGRLLASTLHAAAIGLVTWLAPAAVVPLLIAFAGELALGGIENIVAAERKRASKAPGWLPASLAVVTSAVAIAFRDGPALWPVLAASAQALASLAVAFAAYRGDQDVFDEADHDRGPGAQPTPKAPHQPRVEPAGEGAPPADAPPPEPAPPPKPDLP